MKLNSNHWIEEETHKVRISEIDQNGSMSFEALLNLMQEIAWNSSERIGFSVYNLLEKGLTWVVNRMQFHIKEYPKHREKITVQSWASGVDRLFTYRDYQVFDERGEKIVRGTSAWLIIDIEKRKHVSTAGNFDLKFPEGIEQLPMDKSKIRKIELPDNIADYTRVTVGYSDIDVNKHTNNSRYADWALAHYYQQIGKIRKPLYIDMVFKGESLLGDELSVFSDLSAEGEAIISIKNETKKNQTFKMKVGF